jgi:hypothetical protein
MLRGLHENGQEYKVKPEQFNGFTSIKHFTFIFQMACNSAKYHKFKYYYEQFGFREVNF